GMGYLVDTLQSSDRVLIVDDVHDSGLSVAELLRQIGLRCGANAPAQIKLATIYYKPGKSQVARVPDYYLHTTNSWLVFPHELAGLSAAELEQHKPGIGKIKQRLLKRMASVTTR
ncbi:MAG: hypoxanthine phosphoribosyltransferase, partial [Pseudomonadales bacterium]|nr:hypoxanthine phosphoribosyltransferase [Pseudomonadales bacterium]